jgi:hypothetical protein
MLLPAESASWFSFLWNDFLAGPMATRIAVVGLVGNLLWNVYVLRSNRRREDERIKEDQRRYEENNALRLEQESKARNHTAIEKFDTRGISNHKQRFAQMKAAFTLLDTSEEIKEAVRILDRIHIRPFEKNPRTKHFLGAYSDLILNDSDIDAKTFFDEMELEGSEVKSFAPILVRMKLAKRAEFQAAEATLVADQRVQDAAEAAAYQRSSDAIRDAIWGMF